jgi:hypothetical protein
MSNDTIGKNILALDLGTQTGWAISKDGSVFSGTASFKPSRYQGGGMRFLLFDRWLTEMNDNNGQDFASVYFEEVRRHAGTDAAHIYGGLMATLSTWCEKRSIPYESIPIGSWKKNLCGKGNASKGDVIEKVRSLGHNPEDDNQADAIGVLIYATNL